MDELLFGTRLSGRAAYVPTVVRWLAGAVFVGFGVEKFVRHQDVVQEFVGYGLPESSLIVYLVGLLELGGGLMLLLGIGTRLAALGLAADMIVAISTAGRTVGGPIHLGLAPTLLVLMLFVLWAGSGALALDRRLVR